MVKLFLLTAKDGATVKARITIDAPDFAGAEQDIVILDADGKPVAVVQMQPGIDRREVASPPATP